MSGFRWFNGVVGTLANVLLVLALVAGVTTAVTLLDLPMWARVLILAGLVVLVLLEGAYRVFREADDRATRLEQALAAAQPPKSPRTGVRLREDSTFTNRGRLRISGQDAAFDAEGSNVELGEQGDTEVD